MPEKPPDFRTVLAALKAADVRFVVIGGLAMTAHGSSYVTMDIDVGYARDRRNIAALTAPCDFASSPQRLTRRSALHLG